MQDSVICTPWPRLHGIGSHDRNPAPEALQDLSKVNGEEVVDEILVSSNNAAQVNDSTPPCDEFHHSRSHSHVNKFWTLSKENKDSSTKSSHQQSKVTRVSNGQPNKFEAINGHRSREHVPRARKCEACHRQVLGQEESCKAKERHLKGHQQCHSCTEPLPSQKRWTVSSKLVSCSPRGEQFVFNEFCKRIPNSLTSNTICILFIG